MAKQSLKIADEAILQKIADIIGPTSAAAKSLQDLQRRRDEGEDAVIYDAGNGTLLVGPRIEEIE